MPRESLPAPTSDASAVPMSHGRAGWSGDEHRLMVSAAKEAGLRPEEAALESFTKGFSDAIEVDAPDDRAVVARGRTVLRKNQLDKVLIPALKFLGIARDEYRLRVHDGDFELRLGKLAVERAAATQGAPTDALKLLIGCGLLGAALHQLVVPWAGAIVWGAGLLLAAWALRRGLTSGRAMLAGKLAIALGMIAQENGQVLPPAGERPALPPESEPQAQGDGEGEPG